MLKRIEYMDIAKSFGIICVILGHMGNLYVKRFVFSFHMPLFFVISGYFLSDKMTPKDIFIKRSKQLIPPYIFTCASILLLSIVKNLAGMAYGLKDIRNLFYDAYIGFMRQCMVRVLSIIYRLRLFQ